MTEITNSNPYGKLEKERLERFKSEYGVILPDDYEVFLLDNYGGVPVPDTFWIVPNKDASSLHKFYGLYDSQKGITLDSLFEEDYVPISMMAIGDDGTGNLLCMGITLENLGKIYFLDHELHPPDSNSMKGTTLIAGSFTEFLNSLIDYFE